MQVPVALLREALATALAPVGSRLRVRPGVMYSTRLDRELSLTDHASQAEFQSACLGIHDIAALQIL